MASYNKFNNFVQDLCEGIHNFKSGGATYSVMLTNTAPVATNHTYSSLTDLSTAGGYTAGGATSAMSDSLSTATEKVLATNVTWTGTSGGFGPFRYVVVYQSGDASKETVCWFDFGSSISIPSGGTFTVAFDGTNGLFQLT